jgi:hypothetical protein
VKTDARPPRVVEDLALACNLVPGAEGERREEVRGQRREGGGQRREEGRRLEGREGGGRRLEGRGGRYEGRGEKEMRGIAEMKKEIHTEPPKQERANITIRKIHTQSRVHWVM